MLPRYDRMWLVGRLPAILHYINTMQHSRYNLNKLQLELMQLDRFFTMFLDKFAKEMDPDTPDTPIWKLYRKKTLDYNRIATDIRAARYYEKL
jgi:hypothetical protein